MHQQVQFINNWVDSEKKQIGGGGLFHYVLEWDLDHANHPFLTNLCQFVYVITLCELHIFLYTTSTNMESNNP